MHRWKKFAALSLICAGFAASGGVVANETAAAEILIDENLEQRNILDATAFAEVYGDGEKISSVILKYSKVLNPKKISAAYFKVDGKIIESVHVSDKPELTDVDKQGRYVILKFVNENSAFDGNLSQRPQNKNPNEKNQREKNFDKGDAPMRFDRKPPELSFTVKQVGIITAADGTKFLPGNFFVDGSKISAPIIDSFKQFVYTDPTTGFSMPYNLFLPEGYDKNKSYPLVFFVADASANINDVKTPLFQGNGATSFAAKDFQKKYPCIILAPQYTADLVDELGMMTTDENIWTKGLTLTSNLLFDVLDRYSVDKNRIYGTGQSQGGMANIAISDKYPELFAAQLLIACQWDVDEMEILRNKNLWIVVCEGDTKAFPEMNKAIERWEDLGSKVASNSDFWDSKESIDELNKKVRGLERQRANINYTVFAGGNHMYTWSFAYNIDALREWLFRQKNF